jgi:alpha-beta hydrolase superfamily lysophospholipase
MLLFSRRGSDILAPFVAERSRRGHDEEDSWISFRSFGRAGVSPATVLLTLVLGCSIEPPIALNDIFLRPTEEVIGTPAEYGYEYDELFVPIDETRKVSIWHVHAENPKAIVVIVPGSDRNKSRYLIGLPPLIPNGYDVILMDYEGFGASPGDSDLANLLDDGYAVIDYALSKHPHVVGFGVSTGAGIVTRVAVDRDLTACIYEGSLILKDEPELYLKYIGIDVPLFWGIANAYAHPQIPDGFDILKWIPRVDEPKLIMHSVDDDVTTFEAGVRVFSAAEEPKAFVEFTGAHGKMIEIDPTFWAGTVINWLDRLPELRTLETETEVNQ